MQQVHAWDPGRRRSDEQQSPLTPQHVGNGEAGGGEAPGGWRPQVGAPTRAIPPRRSHDIGEHIMKPVISHGYDIRT